MFKSTLLPLFLLWYRIIDVKVSQKESRNTCHTVIINDTEGKLAWDSSYPTEGLELEREVNNEKRTYLIEYRTDNPRFLEEVRLLFNIPTEHQVVEKGNDNNNNYNIITIIIIIQ